MPMEGLTHARSRAVFRGQTEYGRTANLIVYTDGSANGNATAQAILQSAEADYQATQAWFGGISLPPGHDGDDQSTPRTATPVQVLMDAQAGGAYHFGCDATDIYCEPDPNFGSGFMVAELVEIFEAAVSNGWQCGQTNGEALSRVLATERNGNIAQLQVQTGQAWWANGAQDYVTTNNASDQDENSNGCGPLFLYYLHSQLGYDWRTIVATGGSTLGETYQKLTGNSPAQGFQDFMSHLSTLASGGALQLPPSGNPFPIGATSQPPAGSGSAPTGAGSDGSGVTLPAPSGRGMGGAIAVLILLIIVVILFVVLNALGIVPF
ncbi:MAG TPA: hypothetical protein VFQ25_12960 [Ktedonobacterales bacterium]|nr:hypothetical protein [Ktedonobacterales bacterium]